MTRSYFLDTLFALPLLILAACFLSPLVDGGFLTDDYHNIRFATYGPEGEATFDPDRPEEVLKYFHTKATDRFELYRPLVPLSFRASYEHAGLNPRPYILANIGLHLLGGLLAMWLMRAFIPDARRWQLLLGCTLFLLSPIQTQVAFWTSARSDSLCWIFGSLALLLKWNKRRRLFWPLLFAFLSMLSKEPGLIFLGLIGFIELLPNRSTDPAGISLKRYRLLAPIAVGIGYLGLRYFVFGELFGTNAYGSEDFGATIRSDGWDNLTTGLLTALAPATRVVIPDDFTRELLIVVLGLGSLWILIRGIFGLIRLGFGKLIIVQALLLGPFVMASLVSRLDERFINTRGCYIPMFSMACMLVLATNARSKKSIAIAVLFLGASLYVSWPLQKLYVQASKGTDQIVASMQNAVKDLNYERHPVVTIINFQHLTWFRGGFSAAGCLPPVLMRPFVHADFETRLTLLEEIDPKQRFLVPFSKSIEQQGGVALIEMRLKSKQEEGYFFKNLHPREGGLEARDSIKLMKPLFKAEQILILDRPETLVPQYTIRYQGKLASRYRICLYNSRGRVVDTIATIKTHAMDAEGFHVMTFELPPLPPDMAAEYVVPKHIAWNIYAENDQGKILASSAPSIYLVKVPNDG